ncbi:hypothetical protein D1115_09210 [Vibrio alfacsensis]|uniref:Uncharacterized protein n=1 Tax=Vibrio alfacsensis TaxID=1074311 RepID=A0ABN5PDS5_9VIBR|nr:hypothetical protein [Vibrio alfacsensis]AXY01319.1 hypothetical protein D1115_09210 [Vibrio alfacsensis]
MDAIFPFNVDYEDSAFENIIAKDFLLILRSGALVGFVMCLSSLITITLFLLGAWILNQLNITGYLSKIMQYHLSM